jgi:pentatricopeptide repeat protein
MIACYKNCGQWSRALEMTNDMQVAGVRLNSHTYSSLISAAERGGEVRACPNPEQQP